MHMGGKCDIKEVCAEMKTNNQQCSVTSISTSEYRPSTTAEREAALQMLDEMGQRPEKIPRTGPRITLGADKLYQERKFMEELRQRRVVPHVAEYAPSTKWPNFLSEAERSDPGYAVSRKKRKLVEKVFGWGKLNSVMRKIKLHGVRRMDWLFRLLAAAHNLVRMVKLIPAR